MTVLYVDAKAGKARFGSRVLRCTTGRGGTTTAKREGDGATPLGRWRILYGYYRADRLAPPRCAVPLRPIGPEMGWSDDVRDPAYNRLIRRPHPFSHELIRRPDRLYNIVLVTDWNISGNPGEGSAIFIHCRRRARFPTAGCIAFEQRDLLWLLQRWNPRRDAVLVQP